VTESLPTLVEPASPGASLLAWARQHASELDRLLDASGALLFRGFAVGGTAGFGRVVEAASGSGALSYLYQSTPRTAVGNRVYTATEYPPSEAIPLHNENAYQRVWPMRLFFFSVVVASSGGQTPLADTVRVTARIDADVLDRFEKRGVMYVRNYREGLDLPWQRVFQTEDRASVEAYGKAHDMAVEWLPNGELRTRQVCQGVALHPRSKQRVWMNQAHLFHVSSLGDEARDSLRALMREEELIEPDVLEHVRTAFSAEEVTFDWSSGDVLVVDNMRVSHGRRPFAGERRVLVAMSDPHPA
jgi:alpha-ketoglutarate-dependent taurine dioxygenase